MILRRISEPSGEPLTLMEAAQHLKLADTQAQADALPDADLIKGLVTASREVVENYTNRLLRQANYELSGDMLPGSVYIPKSPIVQTILVKYNSTTGEKTLDNTGYVLEGESEPAKLHINRLHDAAPLANGAKIQFTAGYNEVPESLKAAMKLIIGHLYENREAVVIGASANEVPLASEYLMQPYRVYNR